MRIGRARDEIDEVGLGIDAREAAIFGQREQIGQAGASVGVTDVQPVLLFICSCT